MPVSGVNYEVAKVVVEGLIIVVAGWDLIFKEEIVWHKRISRAGWILIALAFIGVTTSLSKIKFDNEQKKAEKKSLDSSLNANKTAVVDDVKQALAKKNLQFNPVTKTITIIDTSQRKPVDPVMDIDPDSVRLVGTLPDKIKLEIDFKSINQGIAYNIRDEIQAFAFEGGKLIPLGKTSKTTNTSLISQGNHGIYLAVGVTLPKVIDEQHPLDTTYYFFKAIYSNRQIGGKDQPPLRGLFYFTLNKYPSNISEMHVRQLDNQLDYDKIKSALIKGKYW